MADIKPIPTRYKGYHFRSRLEARWAVFFDALGLKWEYEPEGFQLPSGWYLPDFRVQIPVFIVHDSFCSGDKDAVPDEYYRCRRTTESEVAWIEVKGSFKESSDEAHVKLFELSEATGIPGFVFFGSIPRPLTYEESVVEEKRQWLEIGYRSNETRIQMSRADGHWHCQHMIDITDWGLLLDSGEHREMIGLYRDEVRRHEWLFQCIKLREALAAARSARFEHGESGAT